MKVLRSQPVAVAGLVQAALALVVSFGAHLSTTQVGTIMAVVAAVLALVVRSQVTPTGPGAGSSSTTGGGSGG